MTELSKVEIVNYLVAKGFRADIATIYADQFISYRYATKKIEEDGLMVNHPRTGNPMENPYVAIRTKTIPILEKLGNEHCEALWS